MSEQTGLDALSQAIEFIDEAWDYFNEHGFDGVDTEDLVRAHWWMTTCHWRDLLAEITSDLEGSLDRPVGRPDGTWLVPSTKTKRKAWDNAGLVSALRQKFTVTAVTEDGEWGHALDPEILELLAPATGRTKQWRDRVFGGEYGVLDEYAGEVVEVRVLAVSEEDPDA